MKTLPHIIRLSLLLLVVATPWLFGGVWARVQWVLMLALAVLLAVDVIARFGDEDRPNLLPTAWLPLLAGILLGVFQLVPLSPGIANWLSPASLNWRTEFLAPGSGTSNPVNSDQPAERADSSDIAAKSPLAITSAPRTLYAVATREYLALLCLGTAVFVLASLYLADKQSILWFSTAVAICGAALSFFGLIQRLSWNGKFYWVFEPLYGGFQSFGPFVNRNNAGGFLNLCLAAGMGLLIWTHWNRLELSTDEHRSSSRRRRHRSRSDDRVSSHSRSRRRSRKTGQSESDRPRTDVEVANKETSNSTLDGASWEAYQAAKSRSSAEETAPDATDTAKPIESADDPDMECDRSDRRDSHRRSQRSRSTSRTRRSSSRSGRSVGRKSSYSARPNPTLGESVEAIRDRIGQYVGSLNAMRLWSIALVAFIAGGVLCTASRGSILAMFVAAMVTCVALAFRSGNRGHAVGLVVVMLAGAGIMSWAGQTQYVQERLASMLDESTYDTGRLPNWMEAMNTVPEFCVAGTGLGTYRFVYERFQHRYLRDLAHYHAENQFVQALVEGGIVALLLLLVAIALTAAAILRLYRTGGAVNTTLAVVGTFALTSQIVGGSFDFGLYIPSNMMLMAAICGIVVGRAALLTVWSSQVLDDSGRGLSFQSSRHSPDEQRHRRHANDDLLSDGEQVVHGSTRSRRAFKSRHASATEGSTPNLVSVPAPSSVATLIVGILLLGCLFGSLELNKAAKIEVAMRAAQLSDIREIEDPGFVASIISPLQATLPNRWDDALAHRRLAELRMQHYRAETYQRLLAEKNVETPDAKDDDNENSAESQRDEDLWRRSSVWHLNGTLRQLDREGDSASIEALVNQPSVQDHLLPAMKHVLLARKSAPTIPQLHYMLAELSAVNDVKSDDQIHLNRARTLSPGDATMWYWTGLLDLNANRNEQACQSWRKSLLLTPMHLSDIMDSARGQLTIRQILDDVLPMDSEILLKTANEYFSGEAQTSIRNRFLKRAEEALDQTDLPADRLAYITAKIYLLQGRGEEAVPFFKTAVDLNSFTTSWRYDYACLLRDLEKYDEALEQAVVLTSQKPDSARFRRLYEQISGLRHRSGSSK